MQDTESSVSLLSFMPHPISPTLSSRLHGYGHIYVRTDEFFYLCNWATMQILLQIAILSTVQQHVQFFGYRVSERQIRASFCPEFGIWNLEVSRMFFFGAPGEKSLKAKERTTSNLTHMWRRLRDSNPSHISGGRVLLPLRHPCFPTPKCIKN